MAAGTRPAGGLFGDDLQTVRQAIEAQLDSLLTEQQAAAEHIGADYAELAAVFGRLIRQGGKRLRPMLTIWAYAASGGTDQAAILKAAASQELLHAGILMHDDIIDRDTVRWGMPNVSGYYIEQWRQTFAAGKARQLADNCALLAGDGCIDLAYRQLLDSGFAAERVVAGLRLMHQTFFTMLGGELLDVTASFKPLGQLKRQDLLAIYRYKTAAYSFCLPLELGALLAGATTAEQARLHELGIELGIAYQLRDDWLGIFGDEAQTGKSVLSDIREGKRTLLVSLAYERSDRAGRQLLRRWLGNAKTTAREAELVREVLRSSEAEAYTSQLVRQYCRHSLDRALQLGWPQPYSTWLNDVIQGLQDRRV